MPQGYYRNVDDAYSDPELIMAKYLIGRSAYFEVQLTLAEFADSIKSLSGGSASGTPTFTEALGLESDEVNRTCPAMNQYIWVERDNLPTPITVVELFDNWESELVYDPIQSNFNPIKAAEPIVQDVVEIETFKGCKSVVSLTHKVIKNTADKLGIKMEIDSEVLSFISPSTIQADMLIKIEPAGKSETLHLSLDKGFIYVTGSHQDSGIVSHNRKIEPFITA